MEHHVRARAIPWLVAAAVAFAACTGGADPGTTARTDRPEAAEVGPSVSPSALATAEENPLPPGVREPPNWLGTRVLEVGPDGFGIATSTPRLLRDRRFATIDHLPPPGSKRFEYSISRVPRRILKRSTWQPACPVNRSDLGYVTVSFWGFDGRPHTGELILNRSVARGIVGVFRKLYQARWPIEEMRITRSPELDAPPTGDGNNTGAFVCRPARGSDTWSQHAYGLAVDVNPFHNPYVRDEVVLPELARAYRDRSDRRPGMIRAGDVVTKAFFSIGWGWGGTWSSSKDWMHFSASGN